MSGELKIQEGTVFNSDKVIHNPDDDFFREFLKPYYVVTRDNQYLFSSFQVGRRPDRAFYMVPDGYRLGKGQKKFDAKAGKGIYEVALRYLKTANVIVQEGVQGEKGYEVGLRVVVSVENPHSGYISWIGKQMVFPPKDGLKISCWNYIIPERLPEELTDEIKGHWPDYDPDQPLTLYDLTDMEGDVRRVLSLGVDYFGGAFKKPCLTMVWNKAEAEGLISYHAGCTTSRVLKGLSGTGKTTLTVGPELEQDDALVGKPILNEDGKVEAVHIIGLEAASFAKSEGLDENSPEYPGLMKSRELDADGNPHVIIATTIDCEGVDFVTEEIAGYKVKIPKAADGKEVGALLCDSYEKSGTTNGRFVFLFSELNPDWGKNPNKMLGVEGLCFKRFDVLDPILRVTDPAMAIAFDSACESIITSAVAGRKPGTRVRSYAATDFMVREHAEQALLKLKVCSELGLGTDGKLIFIIVNTGFVGENDINGNQIPALDGDGKPIPRINKQTGEVKRDKDGNVRYMGMGEDITVEDSKKLVDLLENDRIENWLKHPIFGYLVPDPHELEEKFGMKDFGRRFNPLRHYTPAEILNFARRDIEERSEFLKNLFSGQVGEEELGDVINAWKKITLPSESEVEKFYSEHYG